MTLKHRILCLEARQPNAGRWGGASRQAILRAVGAYRDPEDLPSDLLDAYVRLSYGEGNHTPEEAELYRLLEEGGFDLGAAH